MKTQIPATHTAADTPLAPGEIPFLFRQHSLMTLSGHTLRPGGFMLTERAVDVCGFDQTDLILDAGCGSGMTGRYLAEQHGIRSTGCDISMDTLSAARRRQSTAKSRLSFLGSRLPALPFKPGSFTGIFSECVLSLVGEKEKCLAEFYRLLKPNGRLVLTDLYIPQRFAAFTRPPEPDTPIDSCLEGALPIVDLIRKVEAAGFTVDMMEDHTCLLRQLAGQIIFKHENLERYWGKNGEQRCCEAAGSAFVAGRRKPGYLLLVAGKYA